VIVRRVTLLATVGALSVGASACGSDDDSAASTTAVPATAAPTTAAPTTAAPTTAAPTTAAPTTAAPTTAAATTEPPPTEAGVEAAAAGDPAVAAGAAWSLVFDSDEPFDAKAVHLADAERLRGTVEAYAGAGSGFGGISLEPTDVVVDGETATITYDVNFGANPAYGDQVGTISLVDGVWTVSADEFCSFMASARVSCP